MLDSPTRRRYIGSSVAFCILFISLLQTLLLLGEVVLPAYAASDDRFTLVILHTNDVHARFDESSPRGSICRPTDSVCYGGVARRATAVREIRRKYSNVVLLDAGDQYQGTVWFSVHKGQAAGYFMNRLGYDAMALGNHEFDNSIDGLIPFIRNVTFPIVCSNINTSHEPRMAGLFNKSVVLTVGGQRIGVVGYIAKETPALSKTGQLNFLDEVSSVQSEVDRLTGEGVNKIIALGHAGIKTDRALAAKVRGIDVVVGGHTNTFLYTGKEPAEEKAEDVYPIVISQPTTGDRVLVTQAYAFGKYLGFLKVTFDGDGRVVMWDGNPRLMDNTVEPDAEILEELVPWRAPIDAMYHINVGVTLNKLDGDFVVCRTKECTMGDVIADAMIDHYRRQLPQLSDVSIALLNGGSIRSTIDTGNVTYADVMEVLPFGTTIDVVELSGADVREVLEYAVQDYDPCSRHGKFLQVAGLQVTYDLSRPNNQRVAEVEVAINGSGSQYVPLDNNTIYKVSMTSFMAQGGDGYDMVTRKSRQHYNLGIVDTDLLMQYIARQTPLDVQTDGRIRFLPDSPRPCVVSGGSALSRDRSLGGMTSLTTMMMTCILMASLLTVGLH